jgi:hypothetical protein
MSRDSSSAAIRRRDRITGSLFLASGVMFVLGVLNPAVIGSWGDSPAASLAAAAGHKAAWCLTTWLITVSVVAGIAAVTMPARLLRTELARVGLALYLAGAALVLASMTFELTVTSSQIGVPVAPDWYFGIQHWSDGLATAFFALLAPAAMACLGAGDDQDPTPARLDRHRLPGRRGAPVRAVRGVPRRAALPAVPGLRRPRRRAPGPPPAPGWSRSRGRGRDRDPGRGRPRRRSRR